MLPIGSKAPDFKIRLDSGEFFRLRDMQGKNIVVLTFISDDYIKSHSEEMYLFLQQLQKVKNFGAFAIAISPDSVEELHKLLSLYNSSIQIAVDKTLEVCRNYRALWLRGIALRRVTYIIDKKGFIRGCLNYQILHKKLWANVVRIIEEINTEEKK